MLLLIFFLSVVVWIVYNNEERVDNKSLLVLQGSYGVVKLAYNEDDDKYYVSRSGLLL